MMKSNLKSDAVIGINQVLMYQASTGAINRELRILPTLLKHLSNNKLQPIVYLPTNMSADFIVGDEIALEQKYIFKSTNIPALPTYKRILTGAAYWPKIVNIDHLDIFHTNYYPVPKVSVPVILTVHDVRIATNPITYSFGRRIFQKLIYRRSIQAASRIITCSQFSKKEIAKYGDINSNRIDVVPIPSAPPPLKSLSQNILDHTRQSYNLPERFILYIGHLEPRKNLIRLVQAFSKLKLNNNQDISLIIAGKPTLRSEDLYKAIELSPYKSKIRLIGFVPDKLLDALYSLAEVFAYPSLHEGFGLPILEAMRLGVPVLTSNTTSLLEVADDAALLVDPQNVSEIADGLARLLDEQSLREQFIERGYKRVKYYTPELAAELTIESYKKVLQTC